MKSMTVSEMQVANGGAYARCYCKTCGVTRYVTKLGLFSFKCTHSGHTYFYWIY